MTNEKALEIEFVEDLYTRIAALEEERYALLYQNNKDAHRIAELKEQQATFEYNASQIIASRDNRIAELEETCLHHAQIETSLSDRIAELNALLDEITESLQDNAQPTALRILGILKQREKNDE